MAQTVGFSRIFACGGAPRLAQVIEQSFAVAQGSDTALLEMDADFEYRLRQGARDIVSVNSTHKGAGV